MTPAERKLIINFWNICFLYADPKYEIVNIELEIEHPFFNTII